MIVAQLLNRQIQRRRLEVLDREAVRVEEPGAGRVERARRLPSGAGVPAAPGEVLAGVGLGHLAIAVVPLVDEQDLISLRCLGLAGDGEDGLLADVLGLVADPPQAVDDH